MVKWKGYKRKVQCRSLR